MLRLGEIVKKDQNPLMRVSAPYEEIVIQLAGHDCPADKIKLLACLVVSQTERQYKKYLIRVLQNLKSLPQRELIDDWQLGNLEVSDDDFKDLLTADEFKWLQKFGLEDHLESYQKDHPRLFKDGLSTTFYPTNKKGFVYLRRLIARHLNNLEDLDGLQQLILYFITAQLLVSWESSCIHLGMMILEGWDLERMARWFKTIWPIYRESPT